MRSATGAVVEETVAYLLREMRLESGGLASAQDADTDGVEGAHVHLDAARSGRGSVSSRRCSSRSSTVAASCAGDLDAEVKARLLELRAKRPQPFRDDKAIASWNGLALAALAEAGRRLDRDDWLDGRVGARRVPARPRCAATTVASSAACATVA